MAKKKKYDWRKYYNRRKERLAQEKKVQNMGKKTKTQAVTKKVAKEDDMTPAQRYYYKRKAKLAAEAEKKVEKPTPAAKSTNKSKKETVALKDTIPVKITQIKRAGGIATMYYGASGRMMYSSWVRKH